MKPTLVGVRHPHPGGKQLSLSIRERIVPIDYNRDTGGVWFE